MFKGLGADNTYKSQSRRDAHQPPPHFHQLKKMAATSGIGSRRDGSKNDFYGEMFRERYIGKGREAGSKRRMDGEEGLRGH